MKQGGTIGGGREVQGAAGRYRRGMEV